MSVARIFAALEDHQRWARWHEGTSRGVWHQRQADRICERLEKCERPPAEPFAAFAALVTLIKGRAHKYIRRVPKPGGGFRYYYNVAGGRGIAHDDELVEGAKFRHEGGHIEVLATHGNRVRIRHDEHSGELVVDREELRRKLHEYHAESIEQHKEQVRGSLEATREHGSERQKARAQTWAGRYGYWSAPEVEALLRPKPKGLEHEPQRSKPAHVVPYSQIDRTWEQDLPALAKAGFKTYDDLHKAGPDKIAAVLGRGRRDTAQQLWRTADMRSGSSKARAKALHETDHPDWVPDLSTYDTILVNTSGGKDSQAMMDQIMNLVDAQGIDRAKVVAVHADLGRVEWEGTKELAQTQCDHYGIRMEVVRRQKNDLLQHIEQRYYQLATRIEDSKALGVDTFGELYEMLPARKADKRTAEKRRYAAEYDAALAGILAKLPDAHIGVHPPSFEDNPSLRDTLSKETRARYLLDSAIRKRNDALDYQSVLAAHEEKVQAFEDGVAAWEEEAAAWRGLSAEERAGTKKPKKPKAPKAPKAPKLAGDSLDWGMANPWPDSGARFCTSEHKRADIRKLMTALAAEHGAQNPGGGPARILNTMGLRAQESAERANKLLFEHDKDASSGKRKVDTYLPISGWSEEEVWDRIKESGVPHHVAYELGMRRLSCVFCVFADGHDLLTAAAENPNLFKKYVDLEKRTGFTYQQGRFAAGGKEAEHPAYKDLAGRAKSFAAVDEALETFKAERPHEYANLRRIAEHKKARHRALGLVTTDDLRALRKALGLDEDDGTHTLLSALHHNLAQLLKAGMKVTAVQYDYRPGGAVVQLDTADDSYYCGRLSYPDAYAGGVASAILARAKGLDYEEHGSPDQQEHVDAAV